MILETSFGKLAYNMARDTTRVDAVQRALQWCETLLQGTEWELEMENGQTSIRRTINGQTVELLPLEAAKMDLGLHSAFQANHLPIYVNGESACVRSRRMRPRPLHTDMVASMMLLLGLDDFSPEAIPKTLHGLLTDEQLASLPPTRQRTRTPPGQPSTSGRIFLDEASVLERLEHHAAEVFEAQFERRDGTLRTIRARTVDWEFDANEGESEGQEQRLMSYNPRNYRLTLVTDMDLGQYRLVATDRVTSLTIGGETFRTASAE
jgi:hypothetical protein